MLFSKNSTLLLNKNGSLRLQVKLLNKLSALHSVLKSVSPQTKDLKLKRLLLNASFLSVIATKSIRLIHQLSHSLTSTLPPLFPSETTFSKNKTRD